MSEAGNEAARWFTVAAEFERVAGWNMAWRYVKEVFIGLASMGLTLGDVDPKRFCDVRVLRRDTGECVAHYSYEHLGEAHTHVTSLTSRLEDTHVFDFCRDLGIPIHHVVGEGCTDPVDRESIWIEIPAERRVQRH